MCSVTTLTGEPVHLPYTPKDVEGLRNVVAKALEVLPIQIVLWCPKRKRFLQSTDRLSTNVVAHRKPLHATKKEALSRLPSYSPHEFVVNNAFQAPQNIPLLQIRQIFSNNSLPPCIENLSFDVIFRMQLNVPFHVRTQNFCRGSRRFKNGAHVVTFPQGLPLTWPTVCFFKILSRPETLREGLFVGGLLGERHWKTVCQLEDRVYVPAIGLRSEPDYVDTTAQPPATKTKKQKDACVIC